jgi:phosphoglycerate dehydrogenase-like enzyme
MMFTVLMKARPELADCATAPRCKYSLVPLAIRRRFAASMLLWPTAREHGSRATYCNNCQIFKSSRRRDAYHIDLTAAEERKIIVAKAAGGFCRSAAELAFGLMIAVMRQIPSVDREVKLGRWPTPMTRVLHDKTLGIVGMGRIGRYIAKIAAAFEMKVLAWGRRLTPEEAALVGTERRELDDLLSSSDIVSIHATLSDETRGLIDARRLGLMKPTGYLINTARGPIIDEAALCAALLSGQIAGAGLDVFDEEPLPPGHPLTKIPNVVLTSHLGWPTDAMYTQFADAAADVLLAHLDGKEVPRFVARH